MSKYFCALNTLHYIIILKAGSIAVTEMKLLIISLGFEELRIQRYCGGQQEALEARFKPVISLI